MTNSLKNANFGEANQGRNRNLRSKQIAISAFDSPSSGVDQRKHREDTRATANEERRNCCREMASAVLTSGFDHFLERSQLHEYVLDVGLGAAINCACTYTQDGTGGLEHTSWVDSIAFVARPTLPLAAKTTLDVLYTERITRLLANAIAIVRLATNRAYRRRNSKRRRVESRSADRFRRHQRRRLDIVDLVWASSLDSRRWCLRYLNENGKGLLQNPGHCPQRL